MENSLLTPAAEDEQPKSTNQMVANVLAKKTKKNLFLKNVGMQDAQTRSSVRTELEAERRTTSDFDPLSRPSVDKLMNCQGR